MKQILTIVTCSAALLGAFAIIQVGTSGDRLLTLRVGADSVQTDHRSSTSHTQRGQRGSQREAQRAAHSLRRHVDDAEAMLDRLSHDSRLQITPELIDQTLAVAQEIDPEMGDRLKAMCGEDPNEFERVLRTTGRRLVGLAELRNHAPDLYDMKRREWRQEVLIARTVRDLADARADGDSLRISMLENELRTHVSIQVALQIAARADYWKRLKEHVEALEREIDAQARRFEQTVEERFQEVLVRIDRQPARGDRSNGIELIDFDGE